MNRKNPSYKFQKTWAWPESIENFIKSKIEGYSCHVCCGESQIGDVKIDKFMPADIQADMFNLPQNLNGKFDTVICDPPWELPYHKRHKLLYALRDLLKPNGKLIFNAFWWPKVRGLEVEEWYVGIPNATWRNVSLLIIARKTQYQFNDYYAHPARRDQTKTARQ